MVAKFELGICAPSRPLATVKMSRKTPIPPQATSTGRLASARPIPPGSGRQCSRWSFGFGHSAASRTKETIRTRAAAQKKSQSGIGMSERAATPWAYAGAGAVEARTAPTATAFAARLTD